MFLKIPEDRVAVLIGKKGRVKKKIESATKTYVKIEGNSIDIEGDIEGVLKASNIVKAIGRGFSPKKAMKLLKDDYFLDIITMSGESMNTIRRLFGRVIGRGGKTRKRLESITDTYISVYGKSVAIIGRYEDVNRVRYAIEKILKGRRYGSVYRSLKRKIQL